MSEYELYQPPAPGEPLRGVKGNFKTWREARAWAGQAGLVEFGGYNIRIVKMKGPVYLGGPVEWVVWFEYEKVTPAAAAADGGACAD